MSARQLALSDLRVDHLHLMLAVAEHPEGARTRGVAHTLDIRIDTVGKALERLEHLGLLESSRITGQQGSPKVYALTDAGWVKLAAHRDELCDRLARISAALGRHE